MIETKRLFIAIPVLPSQSMLDELAKIRNALSSDSIKWIAPNQFHLTLKYIGETPVSKMESIERAMKNAFLDIKRFDVSLESLKIFGSEYKPRILWTRFCPSETATDLFEKLKTEMEGIGYEYDRQNFVPHITLGRINTIHNRHLLKKLTDNYEHFCFARTIASEVVLYESVLKFSEPEYKNWFSLSLIQ
ncbi:MAG: RNA 2',3'-cyclic phosphodiesterase [Bacteroidetes bacterium HGW-Bacteroidetes-6]|jgi:2'-5' RNA ligase|nr:MAG: RNA 2',3'-cyclic phosphodiesterase [Bacteroidetes bacterium HGW-Bacteroidetes-6]